MIFRRITISNLFSYRGTQIYDFTEAAAGTVALVVARNGFGKTSLLNAIKLLFLGTEDKTLRRVGFPPRNLTRGDYVLGAADYGVRVELGDADATLFGC